MVWCASMYVCSLRPHLLARSMIVHRFRICRVPVLLATSLNTTDLQKHPHVNWTDS